VFVLYAFPNLFVQITIVTLVITQGGFKDAGFIAAARMIGIECILR
jgi:hypothetical protein